MTMGSFHLLVSSSILIIGVLYFILWKFFISLVTLILSYFSFSEAIINEIVFLISYSINFLLV
jgi:hypothetical protein